MVLVAGKMYRPTDVAFDIANNSVFVVEQFNHRISKWDYTDANYDFTLDATWGNNSDGTTGEGAPISSTTDNALYRPSGIVFDGTRLYVTDTFHNRVRVVSIADGSFTNSIGAGGFDTDKFYHPAGIEVNDALDTIVIADELNHRAVKYTTGDPPTTPVVLTDPSVTTGLSFIRPHGVAYDTTNDFFNVTDSLRGRVSRYSSDATTFQDQFGFPGTTGINLFYPSSGHGTLDGASATPFADTRNSALKSIATTTIASLTGTIPGTDDGELYYPESVSTFTDAATNYVLAANTLNNRVEAYSNVASALTFEANFGSP